MYLHRSATILIALVYFILISTPTLLAQQAPPAPFQQFLGTWEWHSGTDVFRLVLQYEPAFNTPDGRSFKVILGKHYYIRHGMVIEQSLDQAGQDGNPGFTLFGGLKEHEKFLMSFHDITKNKQGRVTLRFIPGNPNELQWKLTQSYETVDINRVTPEGFSVPTDMVLRRVK